MKRREFGIMALLGMGAGLSSCVTKTTVLNSDSKTNNLKIKPKHLRQGDTVGLIAPASPFSSKVFEKAVRQLTELGFKIKFGKNLHAEYGFVAGSNKQRVEDLHQMFLDPEVKAIWCIRGGYGTTRILPLLDYELIRAHPKLLIGYSDITALLNAIYLKTGMVGLHGPVAASTLTEYSGARLKELIFESKEMIEVDRYSAEEETYEAFIPEVIRPGRFSGELAGGNISLLAAMAGTEFGLDATGKLVFLEDIGEKPYRIDRMLTQLRQSANLDKAAGILLGVFNDCEADEGDFSLTLKQTLRDRLGDLGVPVYYGFSFGHIDNMCSIPIGIRASFDTSTAKLVFEEKVLS